MKVNYLVSKFKRIISVVLAMSMLVSCGVLISSVNASAESTSVKAIFPEADIHLDMSVDNGLTTAYDISGNEYNATFGGANAPTVASGAGNDTTALTLNKSNLKVENYEGLSLSGDLSIAATFKINTLGEASSIIASNYNWTGDAATEKFDFILQVSGIYSGQELRFMLQDGGNYWVNFYTGVKVTTGEWHTVIASVKGTYVYIYYDGELVLTKENKQGRRTAATGNPITVGSTATEQQYLYATVSDFKLADEATSFVEVDNKIETSNGTLVLPEPDVHLDMHLNSDSTKVVDISGNGYDAAVVGTAAPTAVTGPNGDSSALSFNRTSALKINGSDNLKFNADYTVAVTFKLDTYASGEQLLVAKRDIANQRREFQLYLASGSNQLNFYHGNGKQYWNCLNGGVKPTLNEWHTAVAIVEKNVLYLYLDGVLLGTVATNGREGANSATPIGIGGDPTSNAGLLQGVISDVQISNEAATLILPEVYDPVPFPEADAHIDMSMNLLKDTANDVTGNGHDAVVGGTLTATAGPENDDTALTFGNGYLKINSPTEFDFTDNFSLETTFKRTANTEGEQIIVSKRDLTNSSDATKQHREWQLILAGSGNELRFLHNVSGYTWTTCASGVTPSLDEWHTVVVTVKDNVIQIFMDGKLLNMTAITKGRAAASPAPIGIGADPVSKSGYFKGIISDVKISGEAVAQNQLKLTKNYNTKVLAFENGAKVFSDRTYTLPETLPEFVKGLEFNSTTIESNTYTVNTASIMYVLTPISAGGSASQGVTLTNYGFKQLEGITFQCFGSAETDKVNLFYKQVRADEVLTFGKWAIVLSDDLSIKSTNYISDWANNSGEVLYNGITLPEEWPPTYPTTYYDGIPVPYLNNKPEVININTGRQLFVDNFLIESTTLTREWHKAEKYDGNPVLKPETTHELGRPYLNSGHNYGAMAAPFSGGVWYDSSDKLFKMWYRAGWYDGLALATSKDGINWERDTYDIVEGTNLVLPNTDNNVKDSDSVIFDPYTDNKDERFKMFLWSNPGMGAVRTSPDGIHWSEPTQVAKTGDRSTMFYNPFRQKWIYSIRSEWWYRTRDYHECDDIREGANLEGAVRWFSTSTKDKEDLSVADIPVPQLYNLDAVAYESIMLGSLQVWLGPDNPVGEKSGIPKTTDIHMAYSRDGFHWARNDFTSFISSTRNAEDWDRGYAVSNAAVTLINDDELWFYYTAFQGNESMGTAALGYTVPLAVNGMYSNASTGLAKLRRDGFASMNAVDTTGTLVTETVTFEGKHLFVNVDAPEGSLKVEILDENGNVIEGFADSRAITTDSTKVKVMFGNNDDISALSGKNVKFRFTLTNGKLYSFWVSDSERGNSNGYMGGGNTEQNGLVDTKDSYKTPLGDSDSDGKVDAIDFVPFRKLLIGKNVDTLNNRTADVNFDGNVDICDLVTVAKKSK